MSTTLDKIREEIDGYIDGAPDVGPASRLANRIAVILEQSDDELAARELAFYKTAAENLDKALATQNAQFSALRQELSAARGDREGIRCPFCQETGFDDVGLKIHLTRPHCEAFEKLSIDLPQTRAAMQSPAKGGES